MLKIAIADTGFIVPGTTYPSNVTWNEKFLKYWANWKNWIYYDCCKKAGYEPTDIPSHFTNADHHHWVTDIVAAIIDDEIEYQFVHLNVFSSPPVDSEGLSPVIEAVHYCTEEHIPILNFSLGCPKVVIENGKSYQTAPPSKLKEFQDALDRYVDSGGVPIIAAGNYYDPTFSDSGNWLCEKDDNNICVSAHTKEGVHAEFSSTSQRVDVSALGTDLNLVGRYSTRKAYGTSFSTPQVTAILAILYGNCVESPKNAMQWALNTIEKIATKPVSNQGAQPNAESDSIFGIGSLSRTIEWFRLKSQRELLRENLFGTSIYSYGTKPC